MMGESSYEAAHYESIVTQQGRVFHVRLESTPTTGYLWQLQALPSGLASEGSAVEKPSGLEQPGDSVVQVFQFHAETPGEYALVFVLKREWEREPIRTSVVSVTVRN